MKNRCRRGDRRHGEFAVTHDARLQSHAQTRERSIQSRLRKVTTNRAIIGMAMSRRRSRRQDRSAIPRLRQVPHSMRCFRPSIHIGGMVMAIAVVTTDRRRCIRIRRRRQTVSGPAISMRMRQRDSPRFDRRPSDQQEHQDGTTQGTHEISSHSKAGTAIPFRP